MGNPVSPETEWGGDVLLTARILALLEQVAYEKRPCKFCDRTIYFVKTRDGKTVPYTGAGVNHFIDCPHFRKAPDPRQGSLLDCAPEGLEPMR